MIRGKLSIYLIMFSVVFSLGCTGSDAGSSTAPPLETSSVAVTETPTTAPPLETEEPRTIPTGGILEVHFIDVGQGDAILIETPNHEAILVDAGDTGKGSVVAAYISREGIPDIDYIIASHPHADHIGGLDEVMSRVSYSVVLDSGATASTVAYRDYDTYADRVTHEDIGRGQQLTVDGVTITIINPTQPLTFRDTNDDSVVLLISYGSVDFLLTGDCEGPCENSVVYSGLKVDAEILKVGHHGSKTSTSQALLTAVSPEVAVISVGDNNRYGHPYSGTLSRLSSNGITYYRTDLHGTVVVETDGTSYSVRTVSTPTGTTSYTAPVTSQPTTTQPPSTIAPSTVFVGSSKSDKYHYPSCRYAEKILSSNLVYFSSSSQARAAGYVPCGVCNPP